MPFLIRRPEEIAASYYALDPDMSVNAIGLQALHELHAAVRDAGGNRPVVIDSDDLVARPEATMAAYCAAVGLPCIPRALRWEPGERAQWRRSARWHCDVSASSGLEGRERVCTHTVENSDELARFAAHHQPFYEKLHAERLDIPYELNSEPTTEQDREVLPRIHQSLDAQGMAPAELFLHGGRCHLTRHAIH